jgi:hypothetical protein
MHGVQQRAANQDSWPDHARGPNEELAEDPGERETYDRHGQSQKEFLSYRPPDTVDDMQSRGNICNRATVYYDVGNDGNQSVFLQVEWPGIQGKRIAEDRNTILWKNPLQELAQWERNEYDEKDRDQDKGDYREIQHGECEKMWERRTSQRDDGVEGRYDRGENDAKKPPETGPREQLLPP